MDIVDTRPDDYLATLEDAAVAADLRRLDTVITEALPERRRVVWEGVFWGGAEQTIIGYGHIRQARTRGPDVEWFLVGLARQKSHYSIYVNATDADGSSLAESYADTLGKVKLGAASIGFASLDDLDLDTLRELLARADEVTPPDPD